MPPIVARVAHPYGVPVLASGGFDNLTANRRLLHLRRAITVLAILEVAEAELVSQLVWSDLARVLAEPLPSSRAGSDLAAPDRSRLRCASARPAGRVDDGPALS